jgi:DNA-binding response OmpR family regulator
MKNAGTAVSRNDLLDNVWGINNYDIETRVTDETVRRIRKKMRDAGSRVKITAVWGYGYKLEDANE